MAKTNNYYTREEQIVMYRMYRRGDSITAIAKHTGRHREGIRRHLILKLPGLRFMDSKYTKPIYFGMNQPGFEISDFTMQEYNIREVELERPKPRRCFETLSKVTLNK